jgi:hypothetical protein
MAEVPRFRPARMTGWYDPDVLAQSAVKLFTANIFGRHSDTRLIEALGSQPQGSFDYTQQEGDFWFDYVSDVGDGFNPTYAIADAIAQPGLPGTHPGRVLVFGGDQVYPYPSRRAYARRLEWPYQMAFAQRAERPDVFSIPGNHDWFDSLVAFSRTFCRPERGFAACTTRQTRSYFALALPRDWWLVGIDLQLGADLDEPQVRYFRQVAAQMSARANVILCVPEPQWVYEVTYPRYEDYSARTLAWFEREVLCHPVRVTLTGDLHFYRRAEKEDGSQKIISGGGGAFLHPSDRPHGLELRDGYRNVAVYPGSATSRRLAWRNLLFPFINPKAGWLTAVVYALSAWFASARLNLPDIDTFPEAFRNAFAMALREPTLGLWVVSVIAGLVFFTDTHSRIYRVLGGAAHAVAHLFAALGLAWLASIFTVEMLGLEFASTAQLLLAGLLTFLAGGPVGGFIIGVYLLVSIQLFGRHGNEAYSSLRIQDYKQFLRLRIGVDGLLTIWCFGIDRVPRRWRDDGTGRKVADDPRATPVREVDRVSVPRRS